MLWKNLLRQSNKRKEKAVVLSCDELTKDLFDNDLGEKHDEMALRIWSYFKKKSVELVNVGCTVILDWGFWRLENRRSLTDFCHSQNVVKGITLRLMTKHGIKTLKNETAGY